MTCSPRRSGRCCADCRCSAAAGPWRRRKRSAARALGVWRDRHRDWFLALAEQAEPELRGPRQMSWLSRLEEEHDNLRGALAWCMKAVGSEQWGGTHCPLPTAAEAALRLAGALGQFWST